jgi:hypothetical protein
MNEYSKDKFLHKLRTLTDTQQSVSMLSRWLLTCRENHSEIVEVWWAELQKANLSKKMAFLNLCNDISQISRKKNDEYIKDFIPILPDAISHVYRHGNSTVRKKILRLLSIWDDRQVFPKHVLANIHTIIKSNRTVSTSSSSSSSSSRLPKKYADLQEHLIQVEKYQIDKNIIESEITQLLSKDMSLNENIKAKEKLEERKYKLIENNVSKRHQLIEEINRILKYQEELIEEEEGYHKQYAMKSLNNKLDNNQMLMGSASQSDPLMALSELSNNINSKLNNSIITSSSPLSMPILSNPINPTPDQQQILMLMNSIIQQKK